MNISNDPRVDKTIRALSLKDQAKIVEIVKLFKIYGFFVEEQYLKKLTTGLWELRANRWRLLFGIIDQEAVIVNVFLKKTQKTPRKEIELALKRLKEYQ